MCVGVYWVHEYPIGMHVIRWITRDTKGRARMYVSHTTKQPKKQSRKTHHLTHTLYHHPSIDFFPEKTQRGS